MENNEELNIKPLDNSIKPIVTSDDKKAEIINNNINDEIINKLPDWNIEPPIEIKRGNE